MKKLLSSILLLGSISIFTGCEYSQYLPEKFQHSLDTDISITENKNTKEEKPKLNISDLDLIVLMEEADANLTFISPKEKSKNVSGKRPITFLWDKAVFPMARADNWQSFLADNIIMTPEIPGTWSLLGSTGIIFEPDEDYPMATEIEINIIGKSRENKESNLFFLTSFETPRLKIDSVIDKDLIFKKPLVLKFNQEVAIEELRQHMNIIPEVGYLISYGRKSSKKSNVFSVSKNKKMGQLDKTTIEIIPEWDWEINNKYHIKLDPNTKGMAGTLGTLKKIEHKFKTIDKFSYQVYNPNGSKGSVSISFSSEVDSKKFAENLQISPQIDPKIWKKYISQWIDTPNKTSYYILPPINGENWKPGQKYTISLRDKFVDTFGRRLYSSHVTSFTTFFTKDLVELFIPQYSAVFSPKTPLELSFVYRGPARKLRVELAQEVILNEEEIDPRDKIAQLKQKSKKHRSNSEIFELEDATTEEKTINIKVKNFFGDFYEDNKKTTLKPGKYHLKIWDEDKRYPSFTRDFFVSDFAVSIKKFADDRYEVYAENFDGSPIDHIASITSNNGYKGSDFTLPHVFSFEGNAREFTLKLFDGRVGIGTLSMNQKMSPYDMAGVNFSPWAYQEKNTGVLFTDRPLFTPGDTVFFKSILRDKNLFGKNFPLAMVSAESAKVQILDPSWESVYKENVDILNGGLDGKWQIPKNAALGEYRLQVTIGARQSIETVFQIQKFRKPKFLMDIDYSEKRAIIGDKISAKISGNFAFGGSLSGKDVQYTVTLFGTEKDCEWWCNKKDKVLFTGNDKLDDQGNLNIPIDLSVKKEEKINWNLLTINATIKASPDEESSLEKSIPISGSDRIIKIEDNKYFYHPEVDVTYSGIITDLDKNPIEQTLSGKLFIEKWVKNDRKNSEGDFTGEWRKQEEEILLQDMKSDSQGKFQIKFKTPKESGNYFIKFIAKDKKGRETSQKSYFWVSGQSSNTIKQNSQSRILPLYTDKKYYKIGEEVEVFFPLSDFEIFRKNARVTLERGEVFNDIDFLIDFEKNTVKFTTKDWMAPNVYLTILLPGKDKEEEVDVRYGSVNIHIKDPRHKLDVSIKPLQEKYIPGEDIEVEITTSIKGKPTAAHITFAAVDETLLALKSRKKLNMWKKFLREVPLGVETYHAFANYTSPKEMKDILKKISTIRDRMASKFGGGGGGGDMSKGADMLTMRGDFKDTAEFLANVEVPVSGKTTIKFRAPDNLTTWHLWAVAHTDKHAFGEAESDIMVTLPLLISEIVPSVFQMGDTMSVGVLLRNNTGKKEKVTVKLNIPENFLLSSTNPQREIILDKEARVFFPIKVPELSDLSSEFEEIQIGFDVLALESGLSDQLVLTKKIMPPKVQSTAAEFLQISKKDSVKIWPDLANSITSNLVVKVSTSVVIKLASLIDVTHKTNYGCAEQRISSGSAILLQKSLDNVLRRKSAKIDKEVLRKSRDYVESAFIDGGFSYWSNSSSPNVWVTAQVLEYSDMWEEFGITFSEEKLQEGEVFLKNKILSFSKPRRHSYYHQISDTTRNHGGYALAKRGVLTLSDIEILMNHTDSLESKIWWLKSVGLLQDNSKFEISPMVEKVYNDYWQEIQNSIVIRDRYAYFEEYRPSFYSQNTRLTALIFEEMIETNKFSELYPKIVRYLTDTKKSTLSGNTAMRMLKTLSLYAKEHEVKNIGAIYNIANSHSTESILTGKLNSITDTDIVKKVITDSKFSGISLKSQNGKSFYADIELNEVFLANELKPVSKGFHLSRDTYDIDDIAFKKPIKNLEVGKNYLVKLQIVTGTAHRQVALTDFIPTGAEFVNFALDNANNTLRGRVEEQCVGWCNPRVSHQEFHENYARFFMDYLPIGTYEVKYIIRTRMTGDYEVLPAKIEEMYTPEVFATTAGKNIEIR